MKTKEEILKMSRKEAIEYKESDDLDRKSDCTDCTNCTSCARCANCTDCTDCDDCYGCRNVKGMRYAICNVVVGKESYREWIENNKS